MHTIDRRKKYEVLLLIFFLNCNWEAATIHEKNYPIIENGLTRILVFYKKISDEAFQNQNGQFCEKKYNLICISPIQDKIFL